MQKVAHTCKLWAHWSQANVGLHISNTVIHLDGSPKTFLTKDSASLNKQYFSQTESYLAHTPKFIFGVLCEKSDVLRPNVYENLFPDELYVIY